MIKVRTGGRLLGLIVSAMAISSCGGGSGGAVSSPNPTFKSCSDGAIAAVDSMIGDISGTITIENCTRVDSDTADDIRLRLAAPNNTYNSAQSLPNPSITGGYVSATDGNYAPVGGQTFSFPADPIDLFSVGLYKGDRVVLQMFRSDRSTSAPEVSLSIRDNSNTDVCGTGCSGSPPLAATVTRPTGQYTVAVNNSGGPARYVLTITPSATATSNLSAGYDQVDFVPDEAIVRMAATTSLAQSLQASGLAQALSVSSARPLGQNFWQLSRVPANLARPLSGSVRQQAQVDTLSWIRSLSKQSGVGLAEPNYLYHAQQITPDNDPLYARQWHYPLINLPLAWQLVPGGGSGVGVAVMDTGLFSMTPDTYGNWHPDLDANVIGPKSGRILDYVTGDLDIDNSPGIRDDNPADPGDGKPQASSFHGTHVAGTIAALDNTIGGLGVAPSSTLIPVRVLGRNGTGSGADLIAALNWAATQPDIDVINLSLGGLGPSTALKNAVDAVYNQGQGKLIVAAAGNQGTDSLTYPAAYSNVVGVGAVDGAAKRASYSNFGGSVDLVAPGGDASRDANLDGNADVVISTWGDDSSGSFVPTYAGLQGTSMAAPHVTGVYALMKSVEPTLTPAGFFTLLKNGSLTDNVGNPAEYGEGLINAAKAVSAAQSGTIETVLGVSPTALQFRQESVSQSLSLTVYTQSGYATLTDITKPDWLSLDSVSPAEIQSSGRVSATLVPGALAQNVRYQGAIVITYNTDSQTGRTLTVPVTAQIGEQLKAQDAGRHYVLLVSADSQRTTVKQQVVEAKGGHYTFRFDAVTPGSYFLVAGSDADNNGYICENGEACAEYPVNGLPESITVSDQPHTGLVINTSFRRPTVTSMGLPRTGFHGYRLLSPSDTNSAPLHRLRSQP